MTVFPFTTGEIPTASQWNAIFNGKVDQTNGVMSNPQVAGGNFQNIGISGTITGSATWSGNQTFIGTLGFTNLLATGTTSMNGAATVGTNTAGTTFAMNGQAGNARGLVWQTAGVNRWRWQTDGTETGTGNA